MTQRAAYQKIIYASKHKKSIIAEAIVKVFMYTFMKILLMNSLYFRWILVIMVYNMKRQMGTFSNTAAGKLKQ